MDYNQVIPDPPPGFVIIGGGQIPPPPEGFELTKLPQAIPPPPLGFEPLGSAPVSEITEIGLQGPVEPRTQIPATSYGLGQKIAPAAAQATSEGFLIEKPDQATIERMRMVEKGVPFMPPGLGTMAMRAGKQLAETPVSIIKGGFEAAKAAIQRPKEIIPAMREAYDYATSHEGQKEMLKAGHESAVGLITFLPSTFINFIKNPQKQVIEDPVGTIFLMSAVGGGAGALISRKLRAKSIIKPEELRAAVEEIAPDQIRLQENLEKIKTFSARRPEEIETWVEAPRARVTQPEEMAAGEEIRISRDLDTGELVIKMPARPKVIETPPMQETPKIEVSAPREEVPGARAVRLRKKLVPTYLQEKINYGGEIKTRGEVIKELQDKGIPQKNIDAYMIGAKKITEAVEPPTPVSAPPTEMEGILEYERRFREDRRVGPTLSKEELAKITDYERRFGERRKTEVIPKEQIPKEPTFDLRRKLAALMPKLGIPREKWGEVSRRVLENYKPEEGELENYIRRTAFGRTPEGTPFLTEQGEPWPRKEAPKEVPLGEVKELVGKEVSERPFLRSEEEARIKNIILRQAKDKIDEDILVRRFFDYESYESIGRRHGISKQAIEKRINESFRKLKSDPESEAVREFLRQKEYLELNAGIPLTKEIGDAVKRIKERTRQRELVKAEQIKNELQKTDEGKVEWMYLETDRQFKEKREPTFRKAFESAKRAIVDTSGNIKKKLLDDLGSLGKEAVIDHDLIAGATAKTERLVSEASDKIYKGLSKDQEGLLNKTIQSRRTIAISKYAPEIKHPLGLTAKEHEAFLKTVPKEINEKADLYFKEMEKQLDDLKSEGLINEEQYKGLKAKGDYSPRWFINHIDPETTNIIGGRKITVPDSGIKGLDEGSLKVMEMDSRRLVSNVIGRTQARIFRNRANKSLWKIAEEFPDNEIIKKALVIKETKTGKLVYEPAPGGFSKIKAMIDGEPKEMLMPDKYAKEWVTRDPLINEQLANIVGWASGTKILKPMATGINPEFALTNMPRDIAHAWLTTSEYSSFLPKYVVQAGRTYAKTAPEAIGFHPIKGMKSLLSGNDFKNVMKDTFNRSGAWNDYIDDGGGMSFLTHQGRITKNAGAFKPLQNVLGWMGETSEIWTRLALRERALKNGKSPKEATWIARNYIDFSQGGNVIKAIDTGIPYLNAAVQGTRGIFRALADRPVDTMWKFAQVGALASGLYLANKYYNSDAWEQVPNREKVNNFIITTPFTYKDSNGNKRHLYFKVAKDQAQRVICTAFENLMAKATGEKVNADQITQSISDFMPLIPTDLMSPSIESFFGYVANKDFWMNKDIWKGPKVAPKEEYTKYTHPGLVEAGKLTGLSPERLDYALSQFFTKGNVYTSLVSGGFSLAFKDLDKQTQEKMLQETVSRLPFIRRVFKSTPPYSEKELKEEEKQKTEESTSRYKQQREFDNILGRYYEKKEKEGVKDKTIFKEIKSFIADQPADDRKRLTNRFYYFGSTYKLPDRSWWLNLIGTPADTRANIFWTKYSISDNKEKKEMIAIAKKIPGIWSNPFAYKLNVLIKKGRETQ